MRRLSQETPMSHSAVRLPSPTKRKGMLKSTIIALGAGYASMFAMAYMLIIH